MLFRLYQLPERSCSWIIIRLHVCNSNHYVFLYYSKKILINVYISCCNSWLYICKIYYSKRLFTSFSYVSYIIVAGEIAFVCLELFLLYKIVRKLPNIIKKYKEYKSEYSLFSYAIDAAFEATMKRNKLVDIIVTECKLIYYAFYRGVKKCQKVNPYTHITKRLVQ